jgi:hypothetical protein
MRRLAQSLRNGGRLLWLSSRLLAGRRVWIAPLLPLLWPAFLAFQLLVKWRETGYSPEDAQGTLIGLPMAILGILLGVRVISGEADRRTLEIAYTVPGGSHRVWAAKLSSGALILLVSEAMLALIAWLLFTEYPAMALYGAMQAAVFYMCLAMTLAAWFRSEASGALVAAGVLIVNGVFSGFGGFQMRISPFWNPMVLERQGLDDADILAWTVQNRIGYVLAVAAVIALGFARAERRERMLGR